VLKGDMSIVEPRPERPDFIDMIAATVSFWSRLSWSSSASRAGPQVPDDYASDCDGMARKLSYDL
jgi:lipopolysaccharide/colanic/teichoic acid biosynthesis glycosyltransferase